ncbi:hypothetical protein OQA88_9209 [Cercophora sp. LCS_1]
MDYNSTSSVVTIDRAYFDTLLRRSQFSLTQAEYEELHATAKKYENLCRNLLRGGVDQNTVNLLSRGDPEIQNDGQADAAPEMNGAPTESNVEPTDDGGVSLGTQTPQPRRIPDQPRATAYNNSNGYHTSPRQNNGYHGHNHGHNHGYNHGYNHGHNHGHSGAWADTEGELDEDEGDGDSADEDSPIEGVVGANYVQPKSQRQQFERQCTRTIQFTNLPEGITHGDITSAVRGGMLLDIFVRANERTATVSFLHAADAKKFFEHVRKNDLYIKNKRIDIKWHDRQFILPGHVAGKISGGASRNLVIRRYDGRHTEESIRDDLDHIHNLVVIRVEFSGGSCYISLNSVHNAIYARQCMMSRFKYKGAKIEWDVDECAQPYPPPTPKPRAQVSQPRRAPTSVTNRFQLLGLDDDDEDEITATFRAERVGITA